MGIDINSFWEGLSTAFQPMNLLWILVGGFLGTVVGMLPGLGPATAVAVLIPVTFGMNPVSALILMISIYYGAMYGGSRSSILLNTPGDGSAIAATFDGYPMTLNHQAGKALTISAVASLFQSLALFFLPSRYPNLLYTLDHVNISSYSYSHCPWLSHYRSVKWSKGLLPCLSV